MSKRFIPVLVATIALLLSACSQTTEVSQSPVVQDLSDLSHIHSIATDGQDVYVASHHGLYVLQSDDWKLRGDDFDIMGLSFDNGVFYASGHPGPLQNLPDPVGVLTSDDNGNTWTPLSLTGEVDFHLLEVVGQNFIGVAASHSSVLRSTDGGNTWNTVSTPNFTDFSLNPLNSSELLLATGNGVLLSQDFGNTFKDQDSPAGVSLVEWHKDSIFLASKNKLFRGANIESEFAEVNYKFEKIVDLHAEGEVVVVMDATGIHVSRDKGATFNLIATL